MRGTPRTSHDCPGNRRPPARAVAESSGPPQPGQVQREGRSRPDLAFHRDASAEHVREATADGEPEACPSVLTRNRVVGLTEILEDLLLVFVRDADSSVVHRDRHLVLVAMVT